MLDSAQGGGKLVGGFTTGLAVIKYLVATEMPVGVSRVAKDLGINPSTCFNLLKTLVHVDLAEFDPIEKTYTAGFGVLELARGFLDQEGLTRFIRPRMAKLAHENRVTCTLWRRIRHDRAILVDRADIAAAVRVHMFVGQRLPLFLGGFGRCFAAHSGLPVDELRKKFEQLRWERAPSFESWLNEVEKVRQRGFAVDEDTFVRGVTTVAAPIIPSEGEVDFVISAVGFTGQFNIDSMTTLADSMVREASHLASSGVTAREFG